MLPDMMINSFLAAALIYLVALGVSLAAQRSPLDITQHAWHCTGISDLWRVCGAFRIEQTLPNPNGGPQALEGYVDLAHPFGDVKLAIGTIGNIEVSGSGHTIEARSMQAGGVISGSGIVDEWNSLVLAEPGRKAGATGSVTKVNYIKFGNGWTIRPLGSRLLICDPNGNCRDL